jgi:hypothetical protein
MCMCMCMCVCNVYVYVHVYTCVCTSVRGCLCVCVSLHTLCLHKCTACGPCLHVLGPCLCVRTGVAPSQMLDRSCSMSTVQLIFLPPNSWPACVRISPRPIHRKRLSAGGSGSKCRRSDLENLGKAARSSRFQEGQTRAKAGLFKGQRRAETKAKRRANGRRVTGL